MTGSWWNVLLRVPLLGTRGTAALILLLVLATSCGPTPRPEIEATMQITEVLGPGQQAGFARADRPIRLEFPSDHGPHPDFQSEWWYYTGNLDSADGRHFGYQLTFFRRSLSPSEVPRESRWATRQLAMAHFAVTDVSAGRFTSFEQFGRPALGLAGFEPERVWLGSWQASGLNPIRLQASQDQIALDLTLSDERPPVLQGEQGFSRKGAAEGQASYYVSRTRLKTRGLVNGVAVAGWSWMDHEWTSNALSRNESGWDWFGLQLADGSEVMYFQLRDRQGQVTYQDGTRVQSDGRWTRLEDARLEVLERGKVYPRRWRLTARGVPPLELEPYLEDQEMKLSVRYWEGAVRIVGGGSGYAELTGYQP